MRKLFRKIFNLDKAEKVEVLERMVAYKDGLIETLKKQLDKVHNEVKGLNFQLNTYIDRIEYLDTVLKETEVKSWKPVKDLGKGGVYYVVTQGGYFKMKGNTWIYGSVSEVTRRAVLNGFVVNTQEEAEALQKAMRDLVK